MDKPQFLTVEKLNELREYMVDKRLLPAGYNGKIPISISDNNDTPENRKVLEEAGYEVFVDTRCPEPTLEGFGNYTLTPGYSGLRKD